MDLEGRIWKCIKKNPIKSIIICSFLIVFLLQGIYWVLCLTGVSCFSDPLDESDLLSFFGDIFGGMIGGFLQFMF